MTETRIQQFARRWGTRGWRMAIEWHGATGELSEQIMSELEAALEEVAASLPPLTITRMTFCQDDMDREIAQEQEQ